MEGQRPDTAPGDPSWKQRSVSPLVPAYLVTTLVAAAAGIAAGVNSFNSVRIGGSNEDFAETSTKTRDHARERLVERRRRIILMIVRQLAARHMKATGEAASLTVVDTRCSTSSVMRRPATRSA